MLKSGHMGLNAVLSLPICYAIMYFYSMNLALLFLFVSAAIAPLPDIDKKLESITDKRDLKIFGYEINIEHRGSTHSVYFALILGIALASFSLLINGLDYRYSLVLFFAGFLAITFHTIGDIFTPTGINYAPPITSNKSLNWFKYDNALANVSSYSIGILSITTVFVYQFTDFRFLTIVVVTFVLYYLLYISLRHSKYVDIRYKYIK